MKTKTKTKRKDEWMNKIEGSVIAASRLESGEQATCGVVIWTTEAQKDEFRRWESNGLVVVERKEDHDAREAEVKRLREESKILRDGFTGYRETMRREMGRLIAEVERLRDAERQRVAEGMSAWCSSGGEHAAKTGEVELMTNAARLIREVIGRDLNRRRRFGMYQDQIDDLWKVVDMLEAAAKAGEGEE